MSLEQARRMWRLTADRGTDGLHSWTARDLKILNPSQRAKDIADFVPFWTKRVSRNGKQGSLYFTDGNQPYDAVPVRANRDTGGGGSPLAAASGIEGDAGVGGETHKADSAASASSAADTSTVSCEALVLDFTGSDVPPDVPFEVLPHGTRVYREAA